MDARDITQLRAEFAKVKRSDPKSLREWFDGKPHLKNSDHAIIAKVSQGTIYKWKRLAGIPKKIKVQPKPPILPKSIISGTPREDWRDDPDWVQQMLYIHNRKPLAEWLRVPQKTFRDYIARHKLRAKTHEEASLSKNKCCTKEWCIKHYVDQHLPLYKCAELAGISKRAFAGWLVRFEIQARTMIETVHHHEPAIWKRKILHFLKQQGVVREAVSHRTNIFVIYKTGLKETYYYHKAHVYNSVGRRVSGRFYINRRSAACEKAPKVQQVYEPEDILSENPYSAHIMLDRKEFAAATFIEQRVAIQSFIYALKGLQKSGKLTTLPHPPNILRNDLTALKYTSLAKFVKNGVFTFYPHKLIKIPGRQITEHYFGPGEFANVMHRPRTIRALVDLVIKKPNLPITTSNVVRAIAKIACTFTKFREFGRFKYQTASTYAALIKTLGITGSVYDMIPGMGSRALACAILGLKYYTIPDLRFQMAAQNGFTDFINLDWKIYDGHTVDLVIYDNQHYEPDMEVVMKHAKHARRIVVVCTPEHFAKVEKYRPVRIYRIKTVLYHNDYNYVCIW